MHGSVLDWLISNTVKDSQSLLSGEQLESTTIPDYATYPFRHLKQQPIFETVLDIGGQDVNGSPRTYDFFGRGPKWTSIVGCQKYTSIDILNQPGVDIVMDCHDLKFDDENFDLVLCLEVLEHDSNPAKTLSEARRVLKFGHPLIMTCAEKRRPAHDIHHGDGQPYNFITGPQITQWIEAAGFENYCLLNWDGDWRLYAIK